MKKKKEAAPPEPTTATMEAWGYSAAKTMARLGYISGTRRPTPGCDVGRRLFRITVEEIPVDEDEQRRMLMVDIEGCVNGHHHTMLREAAVRLGIVMDRLPFGERYKDIPYDRMPSSCGDEPKPNICGDQIKGEKCALPNGHDGDHRCGRLYWARKSGLRALLPVLAFLVASSSHAADLPPAPPPGPLVVENVCAETDFSVDLLNREVKGKAAFGWQLVAVVLVETPRPIVGGLSRRYVACFTRVTR